MVFTFNPLIPKSPWSLLYVTTVMGIISKRFFFFGFGCLFKSVHFFNNILVELLQLEMLFFNISLAIFSLKFLDTKVTSVDLNIKKYVIKFYICSCLSGCIYCIYFGVFCWRVYDIYRFHSSFEVAYDQKMIFSFAGWTYFPHGWVFTLISLMYLVTIFVFDHELGFVVGLLIIFLLVELFNQFWQL